eukprot:TRINITY_DN2337_c0_g1_i1.p1 TRINITY_DN2337_c0_g1~~TRINITY_DN2337_c0_g1_i1.p1  ORF type:complete len:149 (-),score=16.14 TRINITY_DN2337_c0_g1_i1:338-784(-)
METIVARSTSISVESMSQLNQARDCLSCHADKERALFDKLFQAFVADVLTKSSHFPGRGVMRLMSYRGNVRLYLPIINLRWNGRMDGASHFNMLWPLGEETVVSGELAAGASRLHHDDAVPSSATDARGEEASDSAAFGQSRSALHAA